MLNELLSGNEPPQPESTSAKLCVWPMSGSVAERPPIVVTAGSFSSIESFDSAMSVGASLTSVIEIVNSFSNVSPPRRS